MTERIAIKKLNPTDSDSILKIADWYYQEWRTPIEKTINRLTNQIEEDVIFQLVLTKENKLVATGGLSNKVNIFRVHPSLKKYKPWIALLYTDAPYRNQGLGSLLLQHLEQEAKVNNLSKIYLYTFTAESFYKSSGWIKIKQVQYKGHDTVVMEKEL